MQVLYCHKTKNVANYIKLANNISFPINNVFMHDIRIYGKGF